MFTVKKTSVKASVFLVVLQTSAALPSQTTRNCCFFLNGRSVVFFSMAGASYQLHDATPPTPAANCIYGSHIHQAHWDACNPEHQLLLSAAPLPLLAPLSLTTPVFIAPTESLPAAIAAVNPSPPKLIA